jgi:selenocysteine-specific elongation factor
MIVGTAGHIDHGKTSLVHALTGIDTDRLKEEKLRGISIELGYAYLALTDDQVLGFIDVPGHERFVHTMVAGVGGIDFALLVIAADDGAMPQTREHLAILGMLGISRGAIALTKIDRVDEHRLREVEMEISALLAATAFRAAPIFPVNAIAPDDAGVASLRKYLCAVAEDFPVRRDDGLFRLAVDRVFTLAGHGTIATGTVLAGRVDVGNSVVVMPAGTPARVRSIHAQNRASDCGRAGQRCALNLANLDKSALARGDWLADPRALLPTQRIDVRLHRLADAGAALASWAPLHVHLATAHHVAHVVLLEGDRLASDASALVQLVFDVPVCAASGDRFIVRDAQAARTLGGGFVIDAAGPARRRRSPERLACLAAIERMLAGEGLLPLLEHAPHGIAMLELVRLCQRAPEQISIPQDVRVIETSKGAFVILATHWLTLHAHALAALRSFHGQSPDEVGIDSGRLRRVVMPNLPDALWRGLVDELVVDKAMLRSGPWLHLPDHRVVLSAGEQKLMLKLQPLIAAGRFDPPWVRDLAVAVASPEDAIRTVLRKCATQGALHQIVRDLFYDHGCVNELAQILRGLADQHDTIEAAQYRNALGLGRKRTIQILEFFDRIGYTRRAGDGHVLRADSDWHALS